MSLPTPDAERKALPVFTFLTKYFPLAFLEVVRVAVYGDKQHGNTGAEIRWAREKSTDQLNTALRHLMDYGMGQKWDIDGRAHLAKAIWRLSAQLQLDEEIEIEKAKPDAYYPPRTATEIDAMITASMTATECTDYMRGSPDAPLTATEERIRQEHPLTQPLKCRACAEPSKFLVHDPWCNISPPPRRVLTSPGTKAEPCVFIRNLQFCTFGRSHEGPHSFDMPVTLRPPNVCSDCGADLDHGFHSALCLTQEV